MHNIEDYYYYIRNGQNDIIGIANSDGSIAANYVYDTWGKLIKITDSSGATKTYDTTFIGRINPLRYRGYYYDSDLSLYYLQTRYYDPNTGRFINADNYISTGNNIIGTNMFSYCFNNPVNLLDPSGEVAFVDDLILVIAATLTVYVASVAVTYVSQRYEPYTDLTIPSGLDNTYKPDISFVKSKSKSKTATIDTATSKTKTKYSRPLYRYYVAEPTYPGVDVIMFMPLRIDEAVAYVLIGKSVWTQSEDGAKGLCLYASGGYVYGGTEMSVINGENAYHYHLNNRITKAHIFYGQQAVNFVTV